MELSLDIETYACADLKKVPVYRYVQSPDFQVLLLAYAIDDEPVRVIDLTEGPLPDELVRMLEDERIIKCAYNAAFERVCLSAMLGRELRPEGWHCTMVHASTLGLPRSLDGVGEVLGLAEGERKLKEGKALIQYFCRPCKPTKLNGGRTRNLPGHAPEKWAVFKAYNAQDVVTERAIRRRLEQYPLPQEEQLAYRIDQRINDRGVLLDGVLIRQALRLHEERKAELLAEAQEITGLLNVNSVKQLKDWLGIDGSLDRKATAGLLKDGGLTDAQKRVLAIRQELGKTSVSKYEAMERGVCADGRFRGLFAFYGASRSGRWSSKYLQTQNLPQNHLEDLDLARSLVREGDGETLRLLYDSLPDTLSQLLRTALVARPGRTFAVADFSAIEARVVAWLADEQWRQRVFAEGGDIYCASASQMFHVPVEKHGVNGHLRQKGKIAELALGYGGGVGAMKNMGALDMGLTEDELQPIVDLWREANPGVTALWRLLDRTAKDVIAGGQRAWTMNLPHGLSMMASRKLLHIRLPSGRALRYWEPAIVPSEYGKDDIEYSSMEAGRWTRVTSRGSKLLENIAQAIARDCLRDAMLAVERRWPDIVIHIHDEMVVEVPEDRAEEALAEILATMARPLPWAPGLLLKGDGYLTKYYRKD